WGACMLAEVAKQSEQPLFSPVTSVTVLARADETVLVHAPDVDTAVPTQLARAAGEHAPGARPDPGPRGGPALAAQAGGPAEAGARRRRGPAAGRAGARAGRPEGPGRP